MQWLSILLSFFLGKFKFTRPPSLRDTVSFLFEEAAHRSRKPAVLILSGLACILLLCGGFFMGLIDLTTQLDREGSIRASASAISGFVLVAISVGIFFWIFNRAWPGARVTEKPKAETKESSSSLEQALTMLVMDFIKEREFKREERRHHQAPPQEEHQAPPPLYNN